MHCFCLCVCSCFWALSVWSRSNPQHMEEPGFSLSVKLLLSPAAVTESANWVEWLEDKQIKPNIIEMKWGGCNATGLSLMWLDWVKLTWYHPVQSMQRTVSSEVLSSASGVLGDAHRRNFSLSGGVAHGSHSYSMSLPSQVHRASANGKVRGTHMRIVHAYTYISMPAAQLLKYETCVPSLLESAGSHSLLNTADIFILNTADIFILNTADIA